MITDDLSANYDDFVSFDDSFVKGSSQYFFGGIDTSNVYASWIKEYKAIEDCYAIVLLGTNYDVYVDGVLITASGGDIAVRNIIPIKKGQTILHNNGNYIVAVYGIKG